MKTVIEEEDQNEEESETPDEDVKLQKGKVTTVCPY